MIASILNYILDALCLGGEAHCVQLDRAWGAQCAWRRPLELRRRPSEVRVFATLP